MSAETNWTKIRNYYINHNISQEKLAKKYGITYSAVRQKSMEEKWPARKKAQQQKIAEKLAEKSAEKIAESEAEVERLKKDIRVEIFRQIMRRMGETELDGQDFRRLVQNYTDMVQLEPEAAAKKSEAFDDLLRVVMSE